MGEKKRESPICFRPWRWQRRWCIAVMSLLPAVYVISPPPVHYALERAGLNPIPTISEPYPRMRVILGRFYAPLSWCSRNGLLLNF